MNEFLRENRYIVIKRSDIAKFISPTDYAVHLASLKARPHEGKAEEGPNG